MEKARDDAVDQRPPEGFEKRDFSSSLIQHIGPFYAKIENGQLRQGFYAKAHHCNLGGNVHGGTMMTLADSTMSQAGKRATGQRLVSVQINSNFLAPGNEGDWLECEAKLERATRTVAFVSATIRANGTPIFNATGVFRLLEPLPATDPAAQT